MQPDAALKLQTNWNIKETQAVRYAAETANWYSDRQHCRGGREGIETVNTKSLGA
jgi:hypothetical protein